MKLAGLVVAFSLVAGPAQALTPLPPKEDRSVFDLAAVLADGDEARLEAQNRELLQKTGVALVVLTVPRLDGETIDELAVRFGTERGVGDAKTDRGIVVAFALEDRKIFVATGYGVEGYLPDGRVGALLDRLAVPHFRRADYATGLVQLAASLAAASAAEFNVTLDGGIPVQAPPRQRARGGIGQIIGILLFLIVAAYLGVRHPWLLFAILMSGGRGGRFGGGGGFGSNDGFGGFGGGGFGGGGAGRSW